MHRSAKALVSRLPDSVQGKLRRHHYFRKLRNAKITDEPDLGVVPRLVHRGDVVFDVGANFGLFTRFLSEAVGEEGKVLSFEPIPQIFEALSQSVKKLKLSNVECLKLAVSDRPGCAEMAIPLRGDGSRNHYEASLEEVGAGQETETFTAEMVSLDGLCADRGLGRVDFIKIDVEGHELSVLRGARRLMGQCRPRILLEVNEPLHEAGHGAEVKAWIEEAGYEIRIFEGGEIVPLQPGEARVNYVLLPR